MDEAKKLINFFPEYGDYHNLSKFKNESFDVIFIIEALCHSLAKEKVLQEVYRILKKDGVFIVIDGYQGKEDISLSDDERLAINLAARGMAVIEPEFYADFIKKAKKEKFSVFNEENVSLYVLPTMRRFEKLVSRFFKFPFYPWFSFISKKIFP